MNIYWKTHKQVYLIFIKLSLILDSKHEVDINVFDLMQDQCPLHIIIFQKEF